MSDPINEERLSVSNNWVRHALLIFMGVCLLVAAILAITQPLPYAEDPVLMKVMTGYIGLPTALVVIGYNVWKIFARRDAIRIDANGITDHSSSLSSGFTPWDQIQEVFLLKLHDDNYLCAVPADYDAWLAALSGRQRRLAEANVDAGFAPIRIQFKKVSDRITSQQGLSYCRKIHPEKITRVRKPKY